MAVKFKELKDDVVVNIKVNKNYYLMVKALSYYIFKQFPKDTIEEDLKSTMTQKYEDLNELQRNFYTVTLLLAEIEREAVKNGDFIEKEVLEPGDEGYTPPSKD